MHAQITTQKTRTNNGWYSMGAQMKYHGIPKYAKITCKRKHRYPKYTPQKYTT